LENISDPDHQPTAYQEESQRMMKKLLQQGHSERKAEAYAVGTLRS
jgi:hypothetical protein